MRRPAFAGPQLNATDYIGPVQGTPEGGKKVAVPGQSALLNNVKILFEGPPDARLLLDDCEIRE